MPIKVQCDGCFHTFSVRDEHAGKRGKCPECGASVAVPPRGAAATTPAPRAAAPRKSSRKPAGGGSSSGLKLVLGLLAGGVAFVVCGVAAYFGVGFLRAALAERNQQVAGQVDHATVGIVEKNGSVIEAAAGPDVSGEPGSNLPVAETTATQPPATEELPETTYDANSLMQAMYTGEVASKQTVRVKGVIREFQSILGGYPPTYPGRVVLDAYFPAPLAQHEGHLLCEFRDRESVRGLQINQEIELVGVGIEQPLQLWVTSARLLKAGPVIDGAPVFEPLSPDEMKTRQARTIELAARLHQNTDLRCNTSDSAVGFSIITIPQSAGKLVPKTPPDDVLKMINETWPLVAIHLNCPLTPRFCSFFARNTELQEIDFSNGSDNAEFTGLSQLQSLTSFRFDNYLLAKHDSLEELKKLPLLRSLELGGDWLTDARLTPVGPLPQLRELTIGGPFTDKGLTVLADLPNLQALTVTSEGVQGLGLIALPEDAPLRAFRVGEAFNDAGASMLSRAPHLQSVSAKRTRITDASGSAFKSLPELVRLELDQTKVSSAFVAELAGHPSLILLSLSETLVDDAALEALAANPPPRLMELSLYRTKITADGLRKLATIKTLRWVKVDPNLPGLKEVQAELKAALPKLIF